MRIGDFALVRAHDSASSGRFSGKVGRITRLPDRPDNFCEVTTPDGEFSTVDNENVIVLTENVIQHLIDHLNVTVDFCDHVQDVGHKSLKSSCYFSIKALRQCAGEW